MTLDDLIAEGRALERRCWFLSAKDQGTAVAVWHSASSGRRRRWLTVDTTFYPNIGSRYVSIISNSAGGGVVECLDQLPEASAGDVSLFASEASVLPPIDAVFAFGSERVGSWLAENKWERSWGYNSNFSGSALAEAYERAYQADHPMYGSSDVFAMVGGWHFSFPDGDWNELVADDLMLMTFRDAEPWVEAWRRQDGRFDVIERIT